jgi:hypothetical protein
MEVIARGFVVRCPVVRDALPSFTLALNRSPAANASTCAMRLSANERENVPSTQREKHGFSWALQ